MRWWILGLAFSLLAVPAVQAAHTHDHRYMVVGRILDDDQLPASRVSLRVELIDTPEPVSALAPKTNCMGDFRAIFDLSEVGDARVRVTVQDQVETFAADDALRRTFVTLTAPNATSDPRCREAREDFPNTHVVTGRLLDADAQPVPGVSVDVRLELPEGAPLHGNGTTNQAGDFAVGFSSSRFSNLTSGLAELRSAGDLWTHEMDLTYGITVADHRPEGEDEDPAPGPGAALAVALVALVAATQARRRRP